MTVTRLKDEMPSSEFVRWIGYFKVKAAEDKKRQLERDARQGLDAVKRGRRH